MSKGVVIEGSRALVTGGAGTIGSHVVDLLVLDGATEVVVLDNLVRGSRFNLDWAMANGPVRLVAGDIRDVSLVDELSAGKDPVRDPAYGQTNYQSACVRLTDQFETGRDDLLAALAAEGFSARRGIMASHLRPPCGDVNPPPVLVTERLTRNSLILPLHHRLTEDDQDRVVAAIAKDAAQ